MQEKTIICIRTFIESSQHNLNTVNTIFKKKWSGTKLDTDRPMTIVRNLDNWIIVK